MFGKDIGSLALKMELQGRNTNYYLFYKKGSQKNDWQTAVGNIDPPASVGYRVSLIYLLVIK